MGGGGGGERKRSQPIFFSYLFFKQDGHVNVAGLVNRSSRQTVDHSPTATRLLLFFLASLSPSLSVSLSLSLSLSLFLHAKLRIRLPTERGRDVLFTSFRSAAAHSSGPLSLILLRASRRTFFFYFFIGYASLSFI